MSVLSPDEIERALIRAGVAPELAAKYVGLSEKSPHSSDTPKRPSAHDLPGWRFRMTLPWSMLVSDNERLQTRLFRTRGETMRPVLGITPKYRRAREKIVEAARVVMGKTMPYEGPLEIRAAVWLPDARSHDISNFCKGVHDALEHIVYANDRWLHVIHWEKAGVDVDHPRAELEIVPWNVRRG